MKENREYCLFFKVYGFYKFYMFRTQILQRVAINFVNSKLTVVRPLGPFFRAVYVCRPIFLIQTVRVSGLSMPSARAMRRPSDLSTRTIIINAATPPTNLTTALLCGVSPLPRIQCWHIQDRNKHGRR